MKLSKKQLLIASLLSILCVSQYTQVASALDVRFYTGNDIIWVDPDAAKCAGSGGGGTGATVTAGDNPPPEKWPETVWGFLIAKGLKPHQVAGIMGNLQRESTNYRAGTSFVGFPFNPDATEFPGENRGGYGLAQWTGSRRTDLNNAAKGGPVGNIYLQLEFLYQEMQKRRSKTIPGVNEWEGMLQQNTVLDATVFFHDNFERSADSAASVRSGRGKYAQEWFDKFNGREFANAGTCNSKGEGAIGALAAKYAWPKYSSPNTTKKPEYATAVENAQKENRYVGGGQYPGVDCGGFVTTLVYDSGFDKTYNSNAKGGNTSAQRPWLEKNWQSLGNASKIDTLKLQPGDVAISSSHTYIYVGKSAGEEFGKGDSKFTGVASASYGGTGAPWRSPMAGHEGLTDGDFTWYRKKGTGANVQ